MFNPVSDRVLYLENKDRCPELSGFAEGE